MKRQKYYRTLKYTGIILVLIFSLFQLGLNINRKSELSKKVSNALENKFENNNGLSISVTGKGNVNVTGSVHSLYDKFKVFDIISRVPGVREINDNLLVNTGILPDKEISDNIRIELGRISAIKDPKRIKVHVDNGVVFLSGAVSFYREKLLAQTVASWQKGVKGLVNNIHVLPLNKSLSDKNLESILNVMRKDEFPDYDNIKIHVKNGIATVTGSVKYLFTKKDIENEFASVIGIKGIKNELKVNGSYFN